MSKIVIYPNEVLRKKAKKIEKLDKKTLKEIDLLRKVLEESESGAGLAAPQIGISKDFFGIKDEEKKVKVFINSEIVKTEGNKVYPKMMDDKGNEEDFLEGCLSFPELFGTVKRFIRISVKWMELKDGKLVPKEKELSGFEAIVWQHESDHLKGKLFVDYIKKDGGKLYKLEEGKMIDWDIRKVLEE